MMTVHVVKTQVKIAVVHVEVLPLVVLVILYQHVQIKVYLVVQILTMVQNVYQTMMFTYVMDMLIAQLA